MWWSVPSGGRKPVVKGGDGLPGQFTADFPGPGGRNGEHFRRRVYGRDVRCVTEKLAGPHSGTAGEFEHASGRLECLKRLDHLTAAWKIQALV